MLEPTIDFESLLRIPRTVPNVPKKFSRPSFVDGARAYFDTIGREYPVWRNKMDYYIRYTKEFLTRVIPENKKVLMVGCLGPEILAALKPSVGVGVDISPELIHTAKTENTDPRISYFCALPEELKLNEKFDYVIVLSIVDYSQDVMVLIESLKRFVHDDSRICLSMLNPLWHTVTRFASKLKIRIPDFERNLVASKSLSTVLELKRFKVTEICRRVLVPKRIPILAWFFNQYLSRLPILNSLCFIQYVLAKPDFSTKTKPLSCSVIVPCFNEEGNIEECIARVPKMGKFTEIVAVNDGSRDGTLEILERIAEKNHNVTVVTYPKNRGKGKAVEEGMRRAKGDVLMILDADMTVPPEELVDFFEAIESGSADFASGTRFLYPMEEQAMRFANFVGNILFSKLVQIIVGSECSDTLCGTKVMRKSDFQDFRFEDSRWGDFDLIFHAARLKLKCVQIPVHYRSRVAGESKMNAFSSGVSFLRLCLRKWGQLP